MKYVIVLTNAYGAPTYQETLIIDAESVDHAIDKAYKEAGYHDPEIVCIVECKVPQFRAIT